MIMSRPKTWTQCVFNRKVENGYRQTTAWIDSKGAKLGYHVELLSLDGKFWEVVSVGKTVNVLPPYSFENNI